MSLFVEFSLRPPSSFNGEKSEKGRPDERACAGKAGGLVVAISYWMQDVLHMAHASSMHAVCMAAYLRALI